MSLEATSSFTFHLTVRNESVELSPALYRQLVHYSSTSNSIVSASDKEHQISFDVDPFIFNAYLLFIQSGCFVRPKYLSHQDLIDGLRICGAPLTLINHYEQCDLIISTFSSHQCSSHSTRKEHQLQRILYDALLLIGLIIGTCVLAIDLYRQILIFNGNSLEEISKILIIIVYLIDGVLFLYSSIHAILRYIASIKEGRKPYKDGNLLVDTISCFGILSYFATQRPITKICSIKSNFIWIFVHLCRTMRMIQLGYQLIDIKSCLYAISQCLKIFLQTLIGLFWLFIFSGSILYLIDVIENNQQYSSIYLTIRSAHETLYTIGYRNNAPYGLLTRLWAIISIYFLSSLVQILCWQFQTQVTLKIRRMGS
ncbi:hypothetical protein I4U23_031149 [Adineta vaga]|nr:hypothetical protein I4U23_031149 [Adineta vaga]